MAEGNLGSLDFSLGIRDAFSKPLDELQKRLEKIVKTGSDGVQITAPDMPEFNKNIESVKKGINKLQYAWDDVAQAEAEAVKKNPFADTSLFDKAREQIKSIANAFASIVNAKDFNPNAFGSFFKSADFEFALHQFSTSFKAAQKEIAAQDKANEQYWKKEQQAVDRATANYANIGKEFMSLSKLKGQLMSQDIASPKDEAVMQQAIRSLDQYIERMKMYKQQYLEMSAQGKAQYSVLGQGGAAMTQMLSPEYWTAKNGAVEALRMLKDNWKALTAEQKEALREAIRLFDAQVANAKTAANASKGIEQQEKKNEQAFIAEQKAIDATTERLAKLKSVFAEGWQARQNPFLTAEERNNLIAGLEQLLPKIRELQSAVNAGTYSPDLFNHGDAKVQIDSLLQLTKAYEQLSKAREKEAEQARKEQQAEQKRSIDAQVANAKTAANAQESLIRLQNERRQNQIHNLEQIEQKERELAELYSRLRASRDLGRQNGANVSDIERDLQMVRELYAEMQRLRRNVPTDKGFSPIGFSASEMAAMERHMKGVSTEAQRIQNETRAATQAARDLASAFDRAHNSASKTSSVLSDIKSLFLQGGIVFAAQQFANSIIKTGGDIVQQHIALRSILGDVQKADTLFAQTQQLALQSPFTFQELNRDVKQLAAFGVDTDRLYDTTKRLADVASGLGVSFERLGLAYGQVKARSWLDGKELRQFAYAGLPMLQKIADLYNETGKNGKRNYTTSDVRTMITKRQVSFEDVDKVFQRLTDEGGQFYNLQFVLSETLLGRWNKLQDAWSIMLGKFADGNNIIGQVFATAINGATNLVLALDKISPLLLSFGSLFAAKKIFGAVTSAAGIGASSIVRQMSLVQQQQIKTYAATQMQEVAEGKITADIAQQNVLKQRQLITSTGVKDLAYAQIFAEGRINALQLAQLARRGEVSAALITQLRTMGLISAKQEQLILQAQQEGAVRSRIAMMQLGAGNIGSKLGGFLTLGNVAMVGASVGMALWMGYKQWSDRVNENAKTLADSAKQTAKRYSDALNGLGNKGDGGLQHQVDSMKEVLETSGDYTDTIKEQVENAKDLSAQYDILKENIENAAKANSLMSGDWGNALNGAQAATGLNNDFLFNLFGAETPKWLQWINGLDNDDLETNVEDAAQSLQRYQLMFDALDENTQRSMEKFIQNLAAKNKDLSDMIQGLPIAEQIRVLAFTGGADWEAFVQRFGKGSEEVEDWFKELSERAKDSSDDVSEIMYDDVPKMLEYLRKERGQSQAEFQQWAVKNPQIFAAMMDEMAKKAKITAPIILYYFRSAISKLLNFDFWPNNNNPNGNGKGGKKPYLNGLSGLPILSIRSALRGNGSMVVGKNVGEYDRKLRKVQDETWEKTAQNIQKEYKDVRNEYDQVTSYAKGKKVSQKVQNQINSLRHELNQWENIADAAGVTLDVGKNKTTGHFGKEPNRNKQDQIDRKADQDAKRSLRARLNLIKEAYAIYQKYYKLVHNEAEAAKVVSEQYKDRGLSNDDVAKIKSRQGYMSLVDDYLTRARNIQYRRPDEMKDRKDEDIAAGVQEKNQQNYDLLQEQMNEFSSSMSRDLDEMTRKFNNYQTVLKSTGSAELAARVSGLRNDRNGLDYTTYANGKFRNGFVGTLSQYWQNYLDNLILSSKHPDKAIDYKALFGMSDKEIEQYAGELFGADDKAKIEGFTNAFKKLKEQVTDTEFKEGIQAFSDLMDKIITQVAQQARNDQNYFDIVNKLTNRYIAGDLSKEDYDKSMGIADTMHETQNLEAEDAYKQFMGQVTSMTEDAAQKMKNRILDNLAQQFNAGLITADQYIDELKQVNDQMESFESQHSNSYSFFTGGLNGLAGNMKQRAYDKVRADMANGGGEFWKNGQLTDAGKKLLGKANGFAGSVGMVDAIVNGINNNVQSYKKLEDTWTDAFGDGLKNSGFSRFMSGFTEASQGAADAWNSLKSGDLVGVIDGGIRSFTGWFSWGNAAANRRWEKQAEYLKGFQSTLKEINANIKNKISSDYGSMSSTYANELKSNLRDEASEVRKTYYDWSQAHTIHRNHRNRMYTNLDYNAINSYLRSQGYTGGNIGGDSIQNLSGEWLEKVREHFAGQWSKLPDEAKEYLNRLIEIEGETGEITEATEAWKDAITGINKDSIVSDYTNLLNDLDSTNQDFADSLEQKLRNAILSAMVANLYKDQLEKLRDMAASAAGTEKGNYYVDKNGNIKQHTGGNDTDVASEYTQDEYNKIFGEAEDIASSARALRDFFKDYYGWSDSNSSSMSSSIKGMSETTGDLVAAYLNAMRADLSVVRQLMSIEYPKFEVIAQAQIQQLTAIAQNTLRNADAAERIEVSVSNLYDLFNRSTNGAKQIGVKVY